MSDNSLVPVPSRAVQVVRDEPAELIEEPRAVNPFVRLRVLLYGRFAHAICLGLFLGVCGALAAWNFIPEKHEVVGWVRVKPYVDRILYPSDQNGILPSFDTYVELQASLLQSQRVMDKASQDAEWAGVGRKSTTPGSNVIKTDDLTVEHEKGTELITVTAIDRDPKAAAAAVGALLRAYLEISGDTETKGEAHRLQQLEDLRTALSNQDLALNNQIQAIENQYGTDNLSQRHELKTEQANKLDDELQEINLALSKALASRGSVEATTAPATQPVQLTLTVEEVAQVDVQMRAYVARKSQLSLQLDQWEAKLGGNNWQVVSTRNELAMVDNRIEQCLAEHQRRGDIEAPGALLVAGRDRIGLSVPELKAQAANVSAQYEKIQAEALDLGRKDLQLRSLKEEEAPVKHHHDDVSSRIDQLNLEPNMASRITILSYGEPPASPPRSKRVTGTLAACIAGFGAGVGIIALWGLVDRRLRSFQHVQQLQTAIPVLGVLPVLPNETQDPEQNSMAAHCVHQIRNLLDTGEPGKGRAFAITSPTAGDGKTSLTLALGLSFAAAGSRTLLIDCDMVGRGLTGRVNAIVHRGMASILQDEGLLTDVQLEKAKRVVNETHCELSEALIDLGYVTESDVSRALHAMEQSSVGLLDAFEGDDISACVTQVLASGLSILPLGDAAAHHTAQISPRALRRVIKAAVGLFDVVIVDTGPILGSLEAAIVVREVDEVILTVARDGQAPLVRHAITLLNSVGVRLAGLVFNRAKPQDVACAHYGSSFNAASVRSIQSVRGRLASRDEASNPSSPSHLGSLAAAVVSASINGSMKPADDHDPVN